jgi:SET domain
VHSERALGLGVITEVGLPAGRFVAVYTGELVRRSMVECQESASGLTNTYLLSVREVSSASAPTPTPTPSPTPSPAPARTPSPTAAPTLHTAAPTAPPPPTIPSTRATKRARLDHGSATSGGARRQGERRELRRAREWNNAENRSRGAGGAGGAGDQEDRGVSNPHSRDPHPGEHSARGIGKEEEEDEEVAVEDAEDADAKGEVGGEEEEEEENYQGEDSGERVLLTTVNARLAGNVARFFNHSCSPNMVVVPIRAGSLVPRICLFTACAVPAGTELTFRYGSPDDALLSSTLCLCGSPNCRGFLPFTQCQ